MTRATSDQIIREFTDAVLADIPGGSPISDWATILTDAVQLTPFKDGDVLVEHHAVADNIHFLVEGQLRHRHLVSREQQSELITHRRLPWMPIGWSSLQFQRYRVTTIAESDGLLLTIPIERFKAFATKTPALWAVLAAFIFKSALRVLWEARGRDPDAAAQAPAPLPESPRATGTEPEDFDDVYRQSACFAALTEDCRHWLATHSRLFSAEAGTRILEECQASDGLWLLANGRVERRFKFSTPSGGRSSVRFSVRPGTMLCWCSLVGAAPAPYTIEATRRSALAFVPQAALFELLSQRPDWVGAIFDQQLWQLRTYLVSSRTHYSESAEDDGILSLVELIDDSKPVLPVNSPLYGVPYLLRNRMTREDGFRRLYNAHFRGTVSERAIASLALDLLRDLERSHRFFTGMQATYDAVVSNAHLGPEELRKVSTRYFRDALSHVPYVIKGMEHLPDDGNCILIYNHMAYAEDSLLPNGFLFNPDSHFISGEILEPKYGDGLRIARSNAKTEFWRADYYERLGHISVVTPESGWEEEDEATSRARNRQFMADCQAALEGGRPFSIAPEGTITEEDSTTENSPGPFKAGAFLMSGRFPSRPKIVPVALANFDKPAHSAVFSCVIKPPFTMEERGIDVNDRESLGPFLKSYRTEFRGYVEEAIELARHVETRGADLKGLVTNVDWLDDVSEEFEHDVRALELESSAPATGRSETIFYGSSSFRLWDTLAEDVDIPDAVNLGFGGSTIEACRHYFERLVLPRNPARLILYCGENDIARGASADFVAAQFSHLADMMRAHLPGTRCWFVSLKPSPHRRDFLDEIRTANARIASEIERRDSWRYVDWFSYLLDDRSEASAQLFKPDRIHVNQAGYGILGKLLREALSVSG